MKYWFILKNVRCGTTITNKYLKHILFAKSSCKEFKYKHRNIVNQIDGLHNIHTMRSNLELNELPLPAISSMKRK